MVLRRIGTSRKNPPNRRQHSVRGRNSNYLFPAKSHQTSLWAIKQLATQLRKVSPVLMEMAEVLDQAVLVLSSTSKSHSLPIRRPRQSSRPLMLSEEERRQWR